MAGGLLPKRSVLVDYAWQKWGKSVSKWTIGRLLKKAGFAYKRMRRSCKPKRDELMFAFFKGELSHLKALEEAGKLDLLFYDEAGFNLQPAVPYAWQRIGTTQLIRSAKGKNYSVLGLLGRKGFFRYQFRHTAPKTQDIIDFFDQFTPRKKTVVIMDQAPTHTAKLFKERVQQWKQKNLFIQFLPHSSPELNYIEILWRKIKYEWLPREAYQSAKMLIMHLTTILDHVGKDYRIHFA